MYERCFLPTGKAQVDTGLIGIGNIMPDAFMFDATHGHHRIGDKLENPVKIVGTPVVEDATGDRFLGVPVVAGVSIAADESLHMKDRADSAALHHLLNGKVVGVPATALVHGEHALMLLRKLNHDVGFGGSEAEWLLGNHVFAGL